MKEPLLSTTAFGFEGYHVARHLGLVRGIIVRSRSIVGNIGAALQTIVGGNISIYTNLCERARQDAFDALCEHACALGANAVPLQRLHERCLAEPRRLVVAQRSPV